MDGVKRYSLYTSHVAGGTTFIESTEQLRKDFPQAKVYVRAEDFDAALAREAALREENSDALAVNRTLNVQMDALREELADISTYNDQLNSKCEDMQQRLTAAEQRNAELTKAHDAQQLIALIRLADLRDNNGEFEKLYDLLRNCYPFVRARCEATDFGDASARTTLEMIDEAFKRIEQKPTESGASE